MLKELKFMTNFATNGNTNFLYTMKKIVIAWEVMKMEAVFSFETLVYTMKRRFAKDKTNIDWSELFEKRHWKCTNIKLCHEELRMWYHLFWKGTIMLRPYNKKLSVDANIKLCLHVVTWRWRICTQN